MAIRKTKNNSWTVDVYDSTGRRLVKRFSKKSDALEFEILINNKKREDKLIGADLRKTRIPIKIVTDDFLLTKETLRPKSKQKYKNVISQFTEFCRLYNIEFLDQFTNDSATRFYNIITGLTGNIEEKDRPKPKTVNFYLATVRALFKSEVIKEHITKNPFDHIKNLRVEKKHPEYYSKLEIENFFNQEMDSHYRDAFLGFLNTGCRFEELANLTWEDIDLNKRLIYIRPKVGFQTKTINSQRSIPMNNTLYEIISRRAIDKKSDRYVFCFPDGKKLKERKMLRTCKTIAASAGINGRVFLHKFRHTFASHLIQNGVAIEAIQKLLGHSSIVETMVYAHLRTESLHNQVGILDEIISSTEKKKPLEK